ncbi:MAG: hypothetical protein ACJ790_14875 [Myxococcaceae bacterium]
MARRAFLVLLLLGLGCGLRQSVARQRYIGQMLFDYVYPQPVSEVWPQAMAVIHEGPDAGTPQPWGMLYARETSADGGYGYGLSIEARQTDAGTTVVVHHVTLSADYDMRDYELELEILRRLQPELASRIAAGATRAAAREK